MYKLLFLFLISSPLFAVTPLKKEGKVLKGPSLQINVAFFEKEPLSLLAQFSGDVSKKAGIAGKILKLSGTPEGNGINYFTDQKGKKVKLLSMINGFVGPMYTSHLAKVDVILKEEVIKLSTEALWQLYLHKR